MKYHGLTLDIVEDRIATIVNLYDAGLISVEEFRNSIAVLHDELVEDCASR